MSYIDAGNKEGAKLLTGGKRVQVFFNSFNLNHEGNFIEPTVFGDVKDEMKISQEEIFGPVMAISRFSKLEEVVPRANNTKYGLGAAVFSKDIVKVLIPLFHSEVFCRPTPSLVNFEQELFMSTVRSSLISDG